MQKITLRTFRMLTVSLLISAVSLQSQAFAEAAEQAAAEGHEHSQTSKDWPGIYKGFTPCFDCIGIKTTLALNKNNTYILMTQYAGKSEREFVEKGKFSLGSQENTILLTPKNSETTHQYWVGENVLIQLDNKGNRYTGKDAERYTLRRNDMVETAPSQHGSH
ncbi:copper resistance protein NlpE [Methylomonas sp. AM2-LC]|uniref:copper resistance protein NlpE n=1 Tax=Methylomonas sp. AM2-LC TaxID=3153301 RepID=UPI0032648BF8